MCIRITASRVQFTLLQRQLLILLVQIVDDQEEIAEKYGAQDQDIVDDAYGQERDFNEDSGNDKTRIPDDLVELVGVKEGGEQQQNVNDEEDGEKVIVENGVNFFE